MLGKHTALRSECESAIVQILNKDALENDSKPIQFNPFTTAPVMPHEHANPIPSRENVPFPAGRPITVVQELLRTKVGCFCSVFAELAQR